MLANLHDLIQAFVAPMYNMGSLIGQNVSIYLAVNGVPTLQTLPLSTAALAGFVFPWVNALGDICEKLSNFLATL